MKFVITVDDFWLEEQELTEALQSHLKREVVAQISKSIETRVNEAITTRVNEAMQTKLALVIDSAIHDCIETGTITVSGKPVPIKQHLRQMFESNNGWNNPGTKMTELAKKFGEECKAQYNNIFAGKIVVEMKNQGFLKDDMAKILLGEGK